MKKLLFLAELGDTCFLQAHRDLFGAGVVLLHGDLLQHTPNLVAWQYGVPVWGTPVPSVGAKLRDQYRCITMVIIFTCIHPALSKI